MSIRAITSVRAGILSALPRPTMLNRQSGKATRDEESRFGGSAFLRANGGTSLSLGLYNSLEAFMNTTAAQAAPANVPPEAEKQRIASIKSIITKIDSGDTKGGRELHDELLRFIKEQAPSLLQYRT